MNQSSQKLKKVDLMESCWPWWIEAPRAASLHPPRVQNLSLCCADTIHREQGLGSLPCYVGVTGARPPNFEHIL